jgi:ABC-type glycerol-3-phosphate transport system substrate-binding protein
MNAEETECTLDQPEAVAALTFQSGLITTEGVATPITDLANAQFANEQFTSGKVGMTTNGPWNFVNLRNDATFDWDIAPMPAGPNGSVTWVAGSGFGLSRTTEHPEEAWQALKVITSSASLQKTAAAGRGYPARRSAVPAFIDRSQKPTAVDIVEQIVAEEIAGARFLKTTTTWQETEVMLTREFNPVYLGDQSVDDTIATVKQEFDELLEKHQEILAQG